MQLTLAQRVSGLHGRTMTREKEELGFKNTYRETMDSPECRFTGTEQEWGDAIRALYNTQRRAYRDRVYAAERRRAEEAVAQETRRDARFPDEDIYYTWEQFVSHFDDPANHLTSLQQAELLWNHRMADTVWSM
mgnify:CR=1 FL=1